MSACFVCFSDPVCSHNILFQPVFKSILFQCVLKGVKLEKGFRTLQFWHFLPGQKMSKLQCAGRPGPWFIFPFHHPSFSFCAFSPVMVLVRIFIDFLYAPVCTLHFPYFLILSTFFHYQHFFFHFWHFFFIFRFFFFPQLTCLCPSSSLPSWWGTLGSRWCRSRRRPPGWSYILNLHFFIQFLIFVDQ